MAEPTKRNKIHLVDVVLVTIVVGAFYFVFLAPKPKPEPEPKPTVEDYKYYCSGIGFETIFVDTSTNPNSYYCLDLPNLDFVGSVIMLPSMEILQEEGIELFRR